MNKTNYSKAKFFTVLFSLTLLCISVLYTNSNKAILLKNNVEAISDSNGNDPEGGIYRNRCFFSIKWSSGADYVYKCTDGTTSFAYDDTPYGLFSLFDYYHPEYYAYPCVKEPE